MRMNAYGSIPLPKQASKQASFRVDPKSHGRTTQEKPKMCRFSCVCGYRNTHARHGFDMACPRRFIVIKYKDGAFCFVLLLILLLLRLRSRPSPVGSSGRILQQPPHVGLQLVFVKDGRLGFVPERNHVVGRQRGPLPLEFVGKEVSLWLLFVWWLLFV